MAVHGREARFGGFVGFTSVATDIVLLVEFLKGAGRGGCGSRVGVFEFSSDVVFGVEIFGGGGDLAGDTLGFTNDIRKHRRFSILDGK